MIKGTLANGFEYTLSKDKLDDWNILKLINKSEEDGSALVGLINALLGEEQADKLAEHLAVDGKTTITAMAEAVGEIFATAGEELKNS